MRIVFRSWTVRVLSYTARPPTGGFALSMVTCRLVDEVAARDALVGTPPGGRTNGFGPGVAWAPPSATGFRGRWGAAALRAVPGWGTSPGPPSVGNPKKW